MEGAQAERVGDSGQENWEAKIVEVRHAMAESQRAEDESPVLSVSACRLYRFGHGCLPDSFYRPANSA